MLPVQEAETCAGFTTVKEVVPVRQTLELAHTQGPMHLQYGNKYARGIINDAVKRKMSKAMNIIFIGYATEYDKANSTYSGRMDILI